MPANTIYVGRPSRWGNPWKVQSNCSREEAIRRYEASLTPEFIETTRRELRGKNLACWCPLDGPCHADVLLRIANG